MKQKFSISLLFILVSNVLFSQKDSSRIAGHLIYIEAAGTGGYGSLNYERVLCSKKNFIYSLRAGISTSHFKDFTNNFNPDLLVPLSLNVSYGKNHKIIAGLGQTIASKVQAAYADLRPHRKTNCYSNFTFGYRYQKNTGGLIFTCAYTPVLDWKGLFKNWIGISFGYCF